MIDATYIPFDGKKLINISLLSLLPSTSQARYISMGLEISVILVHSSIYFGVQYEEKRRLAVGRNLACVEKEATLIIENC